MTAPPLAPPLAKAAIDRFLAFHAELVEAKQLAGCMMADPETDSVPGGEIAVEKSPRVSQMDIFLRLRVAICPTGAPPPSLDGRPDIGYVMAALADEALLHQVDWPGRQQWMGTLLEQALYGTRVAGEDVFDLGQAIVDGAIVGRTDLAAAILLALALGFRGRWHGIEDHGAIDRLRHQLYEAVYSQPPPANLEWQSALPSPLEPVLANGRLQRLPRTSPWYMAIGAVALAALVLSGWLWIHSTREVVETARDVLVLGATTTNGHPP
ncbi:MAG: DotU family type IV/VI secretion system protein [Magnetospirillum gryphiswaldense]|nr:DotU family type IV/VI secretion system protein [Magnetospirillum gryphiswaldense]